jgi:hypothetical protein
MMVKRIVASAFAVGLGLMLGSCSPFSGYVADSWPHFAGGEPRDVPPRPGAPGYEQFIAHGQPNADANAPAANAPPPAAGATAVTTNPKPVGAEQRPTAFAEPPPQEGKPEEVPLPSAVDRSDSDSGAVQGGLY